MANSGPCFVTPPCPSHLEKPFPSSSHLQPLLSPQPGGDFSSQITAPSQLRVSHTVLAVGDHGAFNRYCSLIKINCGHQRREGIPHGLAFLFSSWVFFFFSQWMVTGGEVLTDDVGRDVLGCLVLCARCKSLLSFTAGL